MHSLLALFFAFIISQLAFGAELPDCPEVFPAHPVTEDFTPDGNLDKAVWKTAPLIDQLRCKNGSKAPNRNEFRLLYSPSALYIGAAVYQDMSKVIAHWDQDEVNVWGDDNIEIFLDVPVFQKTNFYQIIVNSLGHKTDFCNANQKFDLRNMQLKSRRYPDHWTAELRIPFSDLGMDRPYAGDSICARFHRTLHRMTPDGASIPRVNHGNCLRKSLGRLLFVSGSSSILSVTPVSQSFKLGYNPLQFDYHNQTNKPFSGEITLIQKTADGRSRILKRKSLTLAAGQKLRQSMPVEIADFNISKLIVLVESDGREIASVAVNHAQPVQTEGLDRLLKRNNMLLGSLSYLRGVDHPIYRGAINSIERMNRALADFQKTIEQAVKNRKTVSDRKIADIFDMMGRFEKFVEKYRYIVWQTDPWEAGSPDDLAPRQLPENMKLTFQQASNEREAICLGISGLLCGPRMVLRVVPQEYNSRSAFISSDQFEVYQEQFINTSGTPGDVTSAPLLPVPGNYVTLTPGKMTRIWIIFNSRGVLPGKYRTRILLKPAYDYSIPNRELPVSLHVWNFKLPETRDWPLQSFFWGPNYFRNDELALLQLTHDYHISHGWTRGFQYSYGLDRDSHRIPPPAGADPHAYFNPELAKHANEEFFRLALKLKMKFVFGWNLPFNPEFYEVMSKRLTDMGFKEDEFIFKALIGDEFVKKSIFTNPGLKTRRAVAALKRNWIFQAVYLSAPPPTGATIDDLEENDLLDFYKMWTVIDGLLRDSQRGSEVIRRMHAKGCQVWSYQCAVYMQTKPVLDYYRFYAWSCYMRKLDGLAMWCSLSTDGSDGFDQRDGTDDGVLLRGLHKKPVITKRFEAFREGLEDVAYMDRLEQELTKAEQNGQSFPQYRKLLEDRNRIMQRSSQALVDQWRLQTGLAIDDLIRKNRKK